MLYCGGKVFKRRLTYSAVVICNRHFLWLQKVFYLCNEMYSISYYCSSGIIHCTKIFVADLNRRK